MLLSQGTRLGSYEILAPLGAGGMGEVHRARDTKLGREVPIKSLPQAFVSDAASLQPLRLGSPRALFRLPSTSLDMVAASDLQRFLVLEPRGGIESASIHLILNWQVEAGAR